MQMSISWPIILFLNVKDAVNLLRFLIDSYRISLLVKKFWRTNSIVIDHNRPIAVLNNIFPSCNFHIRGNRIFFDSSTHLALGVNYGFVVDSRQIDTASSQPLDTNNTNNVNDLANELVLVGAETATSDPKLFLAGTFLAETSSRNILVDRVSSFLQLYYVCLRLRWFLKTEMLSGRKTFLAFTTSSKYSFMFLPKLGVSRRLSANTNLIRRKQDVILLFGSTISNIDKTSVSDALKSLLNPARYTLYDVNENEIISTPWSENCELFVVAFDETQTDVSAAIKNFLNNGGKLLCLSSIYQNKISSLRDSNCGTWNYIFPGFSYPKIGSNLGLLESALKNFGIDISSKCDLDCNTTAHSRGFLLSRNNFKALHRYNANGFLVEFGSENASSSKNLSCDVVTEIEKYANFNYNALEVYINKFNELNQSSIGTPAILHVPKLDSTMPVAKTLQSKVHESQGQQGIMVVADVQLVGQGRRQNKWISNTGCAMTSFSYDASAFGNEETPLNANVLISQSPSAVQHIVAMAVVKAIKQLSPVDVAVSIKWPNDIYYNRQVKLGGVLVNAECDSDMNMKFTIGIGINLDNEEPTLCLNQIIKNLTSNNYGNDQASLISREHLLAAIYCHFYKLITYCSQHGFNESVIKQYCELWIHNEQEVTYELMKTDGVTVSRKATIVGVNSQGFLLVRTSSNEIVELHPDGNRFDLTKNLIYKAC